MKVWVRRRRPDRWQTRTFPTVTAARAWGRSGTWVYIWQIITRTRGSPSTKKGGPL